jgi:hypothetical protein
VNLGRVSLLLAALGLIYLAGALGYWLTDRNVPVRAISSFIVDNPVPQGGELQTHRIVERDRLCHTSIERMMFDSKNRRFDMGTAIYPNGAGRLGREEFIGVQQVPENMIPGPARYEALVCYRCNPIHWIWPVCEPIRTTTFDVRVREPFRD